MALRFTALTIAVVGLVFWLFGGPNTGWTRTTVPVMKKDPVTEIEYTEWERNFVPGIDFLAGCMACAAVVFMASWLARSNSTSLNPSR
jgi:hypothetical protein